jgi:hypothetical protein
MNSTVCSIPSRAIQMGGSALAVAQGDTKIKLQSKMSGSEDDAYQTIHKAQKRDRQTFPPAALPKEHAADEPVSMTGAASVYRLVVDTGCK